MEKDEFTNNIINNFNRISHELELSFYKSDKRNKQLEIQLENRKKALMHKIRADEIYDKKQIILKQRYLDKMKHRDNPSQLYADLFNHNINKKDIIEDKNAVNDLLSIFNKETQEDIELYNNICRGCKGLMSLPPSLPDGWKQFEPSGYITTVYFYNESDGKVCYKPPPGTNIFLLI